MSSRRSFVVLCVVITGLMLATPLVADDGCEEPCGSHCGDCAFCPLAADLEEAATPAGLLSMAILVAGEHDPPSEFPRALDHVPLVR